MDMLAEFFSLLPDLKTMLIVCPLVFLAGLMDGIAGGGGLISLPAYVFAGVPIHVAYGTNKFTNGIGTIFSAVKFIKSGHYALKPALFSIVGAITGSFIGSKLALLLDEKYLQICLVVLLPCVAVFLLFNKNFGEDSDKAETQGKKLYWLALLIGLGTGAYDGFFGPATGTFLILAYTQILGFSMLVSAGNAKIINLASNMGGLLIFMLNGKVDYALGIPCTFFSIAGNYLGAKLAINNGSKFIKPTILVVVGMLFIKIVWDLLKG